MGFLATSALTDEEVDYLQRLALSEQRSLSNLAALLIREALKARGEEVSPKVAATES